MPLAKTDLVRLVTNAASLAGVSVAFWGDPEQHPIRIVLNKENLGRRFLLYIWNITHGGGAARAAGEYRIQVTGVNSIEAFEGITTLILGYYEAANVFAGWDASKHLGPVASSPSLQVRDTALLKANTDGISVYPKSNDEVVVCCSPQFLTEYAFSSTVMHGYVTEEMQETATAIFEGTPEADLPIKDLPEERKRVLTTQARLHRSYDFRNRVIAAYQSTCAVSGTQLRLVDAAHILPVSVDGSHDGTSNGICLDLSYHRAFDQGLLAILPDYRIALDMSRVDELRSANLLSGYDRLVSGLRDVLNLPASKNDRPSLDMLQLAIVARGVQVSSIKPVSELRL
jgi:putative restriction endonuclease